MKNIGLLLFIGMTLFIPSALADTVGLSGINVELDDNPEKVATAFKVLALLTVLSLVPALMIVLTSFTRIIIVLSMLRHAMGLQNTPPNTVLISLALFLTLFTMMPVLERISSEAVDPYLNHQIEASVAVENAMTPIREFMVKQTREKDLMLFLELSEQQPPETIEEINNTVLIPAFMLSELQTAFQIGFVLFLPFLLIDLLAASVLMAMGMIMVPPMSISLPIKVLMFVLVEGWVLVAQALVGSFS